MGGGGEGIGGDGVSDGNDASNGAFSTGFGGFGDFGQIGSAIGDVASGSMSGGPMGGASGAPGAATGGGPADTSSFGGARPNYGLRPMAPQPFMINPMQPRGDTMMGGMWGGPRMSPYMSPMPTYGPGPQYGDMSMGHFGMRAPAPIQQRTWGAPGFGMGK